MRRFLITSIRLLCTICLAVALTLSVAHAADRTSDDDVLRGYVSSILERELGWAPGSFEVEVRNRIVTVVLHEDDESRRDKAERALATVAGIEQLKVNVSGAGSPRGDVPIVFPAGDLFRPLIADPKQPQFFVSFIHMTTPTDQITGASVGYGESFGVWRWPGEHPGEGWQLSFAGGLFALFNLSAPSNDLVNADYNVGFNLTNRQGGFSTRYRLYHQSSHLGDEFLLNQPNVVRVNLSIEAVEAIASYEWDRWRVYGGGGYLIGRDPPDLKPGYVESGVEYRSPRFTWDLGRFVAGIDLKNYAEQNWRTAKSITAGIELGQADPGRRRVRVLGEYYAGFSPFGQFFLTDIRYYGVGVYFGF